jgi:beta-phosphoglucomutase
MIQAIIFDLDGVLIDSNYIQYDTFIKAVQHINKDIIYSYDEHEKLFSSLTTRNKLKILIEQNLLNETDIETIYNKKQELTKEAFELLNEDVKLVSLFQKLVKDKYRLFCCSNNNKVIVNLILNKLGIYDYFETILTNSDVKEHKPSPEIYNTIMNKSNLNPNQVLILEDSEIGLQSAYSSKAHVFKIKRLEDVNYNSIKNMIYLKESMEF